MAEDTHDDVTQALQRLAADRRDADAWLVLFNREKNVVASLATRCLRGERANLIEDVTQEVFVRLALYCPFGKLSTGHDFHRYLKVVVRHTAIGQVSKHRLMLEIQDTHECSSRLAVAPWEERDLLRRRALLRATRSLSTTDRILLKALVGEETTNEIAERTGKTTVAVRVAICRLRGRLRKLLTINELSKKA